MTQDTQKLLKLHRIEIDLFDGKHSILPISMRLASLFNARNKYSESIILPYLRVFSCAICDFIILVYLSLFNLGVVISSKLNCWRYVETRVPNPG